MKASLPNLAASADKVIDIYERSIQENNVIPRIGEEGELKGATVFLASDASLYHRTNDCY